MATASPTVSRDRLKSLDQFRGYTVAGMLLVNFLASFMAVPDVVKHHNTYCSYADTIMVQFLFAVGFAYRLTFERRWEREGPRAAYARVVQRMLGLILVAIVIHGAGTAARTWSDLQDLGLLGALMRPIKREWFQTLMQIAVTSLWITPVIRSPALIRMGFAAGSALLHVFLSWWFYFQWTWMEPISIDGGPLGFLTWTVAAIVGTLACDIVQTQQRVLSRLLGLGLMLMLLGWGMSCGTRWYDGLHDETAVVAGGAGHKFPLASEPVFPAHAQNWKAWGVAELPFMPPPRHRQYNYWMMSQRAGTASYLFFGTGFSCCIFAGFYWACDRVRWSFPLFHTFGSNALAAYVIHDLVDGAVSPFVPHDSPLWYVLLAFLLYFGVSYLMVRSLEKQGVFLRL